MTEPTKLPIKAEKTTDVIGRRDWAPLERLRAEVDHLLEQFGGGFPWRLPGRWPAMPSPAEWPAGMAAHAPAVDVVETPAAYEITAELPGMDEKNVEVKIVNGTLLIKGEKHTETEDKKGDYHVSERRFGSYERSFGLPDGVDASKIEATFSKGVLKVVMPKTAEAKKETKINIKAA